MKRAGRREAKLRRAALWLISAFALGGALYGAVITVEDPSNVFVVGFVTVGFFAISLLPMVFVSWWAFDILCPRREASRVELAAALLRSLSEYVQEEISLSLSPRIRVWRFRPQQWLTLSVDLRGGARLFLTAETRVHTFASWLEAPSEYRGVERVISDRLELRLSAPELAVDRGAPTWRRSSWGTNPRDVKVYVADAPTEGCLMSACEVLAFQGATIKYDMGLLQPTDRLKYVPLWLWAWMERLYPSPPAVSKWQAPAPSLPVKPLGRARRRDKPQPRATRVVAR